MSQATQSGLISQSGFAGLISVILPTYNRYEFVREAIESCLNQTYPHVEVIVVDDASTDPRYTDGSLERYPRTTLLRLPVNQRQKYGVEAAQGMTRQEGVQLARGEWVAFLDDDDRWVPEKLERQIQALSNTPSCLFSSTNMTRIHRLTYTQDRPTGPYFQKGSLPMLFTLPLISHTNYINNSTVLLHRSIIDRVGPFRPVIYEDWDYWKRALEHTSCLYLDEELTHYTVSAEPSLHRKNYVYREE